MSHRLLSNVMCRSCGQVWSSCEQRLFVVHDLSIRSGAIAEDVHDLCTWNVSPLSLYIRLPRLSNISALVSAGPVTPVLSPEFGNFHRQMGA